MKNFLRHCFFLCITALGLSPAVLAQTNYFSKPSGPLNLTSTWGTNPDGSGSAPADFTSPDVVYTVANTTNGTIDGNWIVSGANSKVVVGNGAEEAVFTIPAAFSYSGLIDVAAGSKLVVQNTSMPDLGLLEETSTLQLAQSSPVTFDFQDLQLGNLTLTGSVKIFSSSFTILGKLTLNAAVFSVDAAPEPIELTLKGDAEILNSGAFASNCYQKLDVKLSGGQDQNFSTNSNFLTFRMRDLRLTKTGGIATSTANFVLGRDFLGQPSGDALFSYNGISLDVGRNFSAAGNADNYDLNTILYLSTTDTNVEHKLFGATEAEAPKAEFNSITIYTSAANVQFMPTDGSGEYFFNGYFEAGGDIAGEVFLNGNTVHIGGTILLSETESVLNAEGSTIILDGFTDQYISSEDPNQTLANVNVNKATGRLFIESPYLFTGTVLLQHGKVYSNGFMTIAENGNIVGNSLGFVVGKLKRVISTDEQITLNFPVGISTLYMPASLDLLPSSSAPTIVSIERKPDGIPPGDAGNELLMLEQGYYIFEVNGPAEMIESYITISYLVPNVPGSENLLRLGMLVNGSWINMGGSANTTAGVGSITSENTGGGGLFSLGKLPEEDGPVISAPLELPVFTSYNYIPSDAVEVHAQSMDLTDAITVTIDAPFELALSEDGPFSDEVVATPDGGVAGTITVYVRYAPQDGNTHLGEITFSSPGAIPKTTDISGIVTEVPALFINELQSANISTIADEDGNYYGWVEIFNPYNEAIDLEGFYLSTNEANPEMYELPAGTTVEANGFLLLWASGDPELGSNHVGIELNGNGGYLALRDPNSSLIDLINYPAMLEDYSYGRELDGGLPWLFFTEPTPGATNETVGIEQLEMTEVFIFPNPALQGQEVNFSRKAERIRIFDLNGKLLFSAENTDKINTASLDAGLFLIVADGVVFKLVVE